MTDLDEFVPLINTNIVLNRRVLSGTAKVAELNWLVCMYFRQNTLLNDFRGQDLSEFSPRPDVILMSDVVYYEEVKH